MRTDFINNTLKWLDHNRYTAVSIVLFSIMVITFSQVTGCQSTTASLLPSAEGEIRAVTRSEFNRQAAKINKDLAVRKVQLDAEIEKFNKQIEAFNSQVDAGITELDRQDQIRAEFLDTVGLAAGEAVHSGINPVSLIPLGIGLLGTSLGLGTSADNRRKDKVISKLKYPADRDGSQKHGV